MEKIFLHVCCGPCAIWPMIKLCKQNPNISPLLWFYNPNIQPVQEYQERLNSLKRLMDIFPDLLPGFSGQLNLDYSASYDTDRYNALAKASPEEPERCRLCYWLRMTEAAREAKKRGYSYFSTTLLYSRYQKHDLIVAEGQKAALANGINFYYEDFREGFRKGQELAKETGLYRQKYCGCLFEKKEKSPLKIKQS